MNEYTWVQKFQKRTGKELCNMKMEMKYVPDACWAMCTGRLYSESGGRGREKHKGEVLEGKASQS